MEIGDTIFFGAISTGFVTLTGFVKVLWARSVKCDEEHKAKDARINTLEQIIGSCEAEKCDARRRLWPRQSPDSVTLSSHPHTSSPPATA